MQVQMKNWMVILLLPAILLSGCNISQQSAGPTQDANTVYTQAAQLVATQFSAQQTQTAAAIPPTPMALPTALPTLAIPTIAPFNTPGGASTPFVFNTPAAGATVGAISTLGSTLSGCNDSKLIADVTYPDKMQVKSGKHVKKTWSIENTGSCPWQTGYRLAYLGGSFGGYNVTFDDVKTFMGPGITKNISVDLTAPTKTGEYNECWKMQDPNRYFFGGLICLDLIVIK